MKSARHRDRLSNSKKCGNLKIAALAAAIYCFVQPLAHAQTAPESASAQSFDIPAQPLATALREFARQSGQELLFSPGVAAEKTTGGIKGTLTPLEALSELLQNTGISFSMTPNGAILLRSSDAQAGSSGRSPTGLAAPVPVDPAAREVGKNGRAEASVSSSEVTEMDTIVVTGSSIRGVVNETVPLTVLDRHYIESTGYSSTTQLMESLPQNFALTSQSGVLVPGSTFNSDQGSGINLRGIGEGTTLVLLNGRRLTPGRGAQTVDISALPLTAIERVEVLTDGASALYGSDAVGGVVNFILRKDYEGGETSLRSGWADGGVNEYRVNQTVGGRWSSGSALLSLGYHQRDLLLAADRDFVPVTSRVGSLLPRDKNYSAVLSFRQELSPSISLFSDTLYTRRDSFNVGGNILQNDSRYADNKQLSATLGVDWKIIGDWQVQALASYGQNKLLLEKSPLALFSPGDKFPSDYESQSFQVRADGTLFSLPGGAARLSLGGEWRSESYEESVIPGRPKTVPDPLDIEQTIRSVYGQLYVPLFGPENEISGIRRLELSVAGRWDDYSKFGSSIDPQVGVMWEPLSGLKVRASVGTAYKAPGLRDYSISTGSGFVFPSFDPILGRESIQFYLDGTDVASLGPQKSQSTSIGVDFAPKFIDGLELGVNYYSISYKDRIAAPGSPSLMLADPTPFGRLVLRDPSLAEINAAIAFAQAARGFEIYDSNFNLIDPSTFDFSSIDVLIDSRIRNLSRVVTRGWDFSARYSTRVASGTGNIGVSATHIARLETRVTPDSLPVSTVDTIYNPSDWRVRANVGWENSSWSFSAFYNYVDEYVDTRSNLRARISSYSTIDARIAFKFLENRGVLSNTTLSLNVQNLFDQDPPTIRVINPATDTGFDPTNSNPMGRLFSVELVKRW